MYAVSPWLTTRLPSLQVSLFSWLGVWVGVVLLSHLVMLFCPATRVRRIFATPAPGVWRWLMGEFSLRVTLGGGMAGLGVLGWGFFALGAWPPAPWGLGLLGGGSVFLGVALLNAGRKSPMTGEACLGLACVIGGVSTLGLWLGAVLLSRLLGGT